MSDKYMFKYHGKCTKAFTLAEVLITLAIIGIVATLTIPNLIHKYQEKQIVEKLSVTYSKLLEAFRWMVEENGTIESYGNTAADRILSVETLLPRYMNGLRACKAYADCVSDDVGSYLMRNSDSSFRLSPYAGGRNIKAYQNLSGVTFIFDADKGQCAETMKIDQVGTTYWAHCGKVYVDLNGKKKPNTTDIDVFTFDIVQDGIVPAGSRKQTHFEEQIGLTACLNGATNLGQCTSWVLEKKNMEYLRCSDLSWDGKTKCSN
jgi:prepilin-type N-terminal cleavage/methylation domain-containing protein